jgi:micrococcal nuclease
MGKILLICTSGLALAAWLCNLIYIPFRIEESLHSTSLASTIPLILTETPPPTFTPTNTPLPTPTPTADCTPTPIQTIPPAVTNSPTVSSTPNLLEGAGCIPESTSHQHGKVTRVIDGDTIEVELEDGLIYRVRYIGIDTPGRDEPWFTEANQANSEFVEGKTVLLVKDVSEVDQYERLLRYVLVDDVFVNYELLRRGLADAVTYPPDVACSGIFLETARSAREAGIGIWGPVPQPYPNELPPSEGNDRSNCDSSYPTVCIPPYPPDLDCKDIPFRRFQVLPPDPHFFDGDFDGLGCEG